MNKNNCVFSLSPPCPYQLLASLSPLRPVNKRIVGVKRQILLKLLKINHVKSIRKRHPFFGVRDALWVCILQCFWARVFFIYRLECIFYAFGDRISSHPIVREISEGLEQRGEKLMFCWFCFHTFCWFKTSRAFSTWKYRTSKLCIILVGFLLACQI